MFTRSTYRPVTFTRPFLLRGLDEVQPAGTYTIETNEELLHDLSFAAYRRVTTLIFLPARLGGAIAGQVAAIDPLELEAAQKDDATAGYRQTQTGTGAGRHRSHT
ncbi:MAG: hypothetical protein FJX35_24310 [Alphaproteobacteria bacterium]|nr:hypothetical protein [Alphaproteobacteria bacterium]